VIVKTTWALACVLSVGIVVPVAAENDSLVRFDGGIGVIPVSNVTVANGIVTVNPNTVRGVSPAGQIWVIDGLKATVGNADVGIDSRIKVRGRGLLLGGGNNIGLNTGQKVFATLFCGPAAASTAHSTAAADAVALEPNGDFRIDQTLTPAPPAECPTPVLLIRNATGGAWFAAGIPNFDDDDD
jgi:hypothetical protein